jgi:hypothetical protein
MCLYQLDSKPIENTHNIYFTELFDGLKPTVSSKLYTVLFLLKRTAFCIICIIFDYLSPVLKVILIFSVQLVSCAYVIIWKPFKLFKDNLQEIYIPKNSTKTPSYYSQKINHFLTKNSSIFLKPPNLSQNPPKKSYHY